MIRDDRVTRVRFSMDSCGRVSPEGTPLAQPLQTLARKDRRRVDRADAAGLTVADWELRHARREGRHAARVANGLQPLLARAERMRAARRRRERGPVEPRPSAEPIFRVGCLPVRPVADPSPVVPTPTGYAVPAFAHVAAAPHRSADDARQLAERVAARPLTYLPMLMWLGLPGVTDLRPTFGKAVANG